MPYLHLRTHAPIVLLAFTLAFIAAGPVGADEATSSSGMVATVHPIASQAGIEAFEDGGNAIDAAIAAAIALGVVDGHNSGLGGGCFVLIHRANGEIVAIDGREMAPAAATRDMYLRDGKADTSLSQTGALAVGVPGALAAYETAAKKYGRRDIASALRSAADVAENGFAINRTYARKLRDKKSLIAGFPGTKAMLLRDDGEPYLEGETLRLPDLAETYRDIAQHGSDWFYGGPFAKKIGRWMEANGGILTAADFAAYQIKSRQPIRSTYRDYEVIGFAPPSSGGVHVAQVLNILESFDLSEHFHSENKSAAYHLIAEAMKAAFADRAHWLGDADFAKVPRGLVSQDYANALAAKIDLAGAGTVVKHGLPKDWQSDVYGKHTTHIAAADHEGNWVAITATVNTSFGSKVVVPGTGLILNNEMDDFSAQPGVPNAFGLIGAEANAVAPGKRPLSSMSPTIVLKDGNPILTVGAAGGPKIITQVIMAIINFVDRKLPVGQCLSQPRIHHQWRPDKLFVEKRLDSSIVDQLRSRGHAIEVLSTSGVAQAIARRVDGQLIGVSDPRTQGKAIGFTPVPAAP